MTTEVPPLYINYKMVCKAHACPSQRKLFKETFGTEDVLLTKDNVLKARQAGLSLSWLWSKFIEKAVNSGVSWNTIFNLQASINYEWTATPERESVVFYKRFTRLAKLMHKRGAFNAT